MIFLLLWTALAQAAPFTPMVNAGLDFGGDTLVNAVYSDGSKSDIPAGRGVLFGLGNVIDLGEDFELQASINLKYTSVKPARNGDVSWVRWPLELLAFHRWDNFRAGAGATYHFGNRLSGSGDASALSMKFKSALGFVAQGEYQFGTEENPALGLRYTNIQYAPVGGTQSAKGSSLGLIFTYFFLSAD